MGFIWADTNLLHMENKVYIHKDLNIVGGTINYKSGNKMPSDNILMVMFRGWVTAPLDCFWENSQVFKDYKLYVSLILMYILHKQLQNCIHILLTQHNVIMFTWITIFVHLYISLSYI